MRSKLDLRSGYGFVTTYYELLPIYGGKIRCFNYINNQTKYIYGKKTFKGFQEFERAVFGKKI